MAMEEGLVAAVAAMEVVVLGVMVVVAGDGDGDGDARRKLIRRGKK